MSKAIRYLFAAVTMLAALSGYAATTGTWSVDAAGNWSTAGNWSGGIPTAAGDTANLTTNIGAARIITIDTTSRTVGTLTIGDPTSTYFAYTLAASGGASLTNNNNGGGALISKPAATNNVVDTISTPIILADNLTVNSAATGDANGNSLTISGIISETGAAKTITKNGIGGVQFTGANTYSGGTILSAGALQIGVSSTLSGVTVSNGPVGTGTLTINGSSTLTGRGGSRTLHNALSVAADLSFGTANNNQITLPGTLDLNSGTRTFTVGNGTANPDVILSGVISNGGLTKAGAGELFLTATNSYSGDTRIVAGGLILDEADAAANSNSSLQNSTVDMNAADAGNLLFRGSTSTTNATLGGLKGSRNVNLATTSGAAVTLIVGGNAQSTTYSGVLSGATGASLTKTGAGTLILSGANTYDGLTTISGGSLQLGSGGSIGSLTNSGTLVNDANLTINRNDIVVQGTDFSSSAITGTGSFTQAGSGTTILNTANSYGGATTVSAGKLVVSSEQTGTGAASVANGAALGVTAFGVSQWQPTTLTLGTSTGCILEFNSVANPGTTAAPLSPGSVTRNGSVTVNVNSISGSITVGGSGYPLLGNMSGSTNGYSLGIRPPGTTGHLAISGTTLTFVVDTVSDIWNAASPGGNWDIGTTANWAGKAINNSPANTYAQNDNVLFNDTVAGPQTVTVAAAVTPGKVNVDNTATEYTISSSGTNRIAGSGNLAKSSTGSLTLSGFNTYTGGTTLSAGQLNINHGGTSSTNSAIGTGPLTISSGTIDNTSGGDVTLLPNNTQNWNGDFTYAGSLYNLNLGTGAVTPNASREITITANTLTVGGAIGGGAISLTKLGEGTLALSGTNTYSGGTILSAGQLNINFGGSSSANSAIGTGALTINGGTIDNTRGSDVTLLPNNVQTWGGSFTFVGSTNLNLGTGAVALTGNRTVTVGGNTLTVGGIVSGAFAITKAGAGTLRLTGANTFGTGAGNMLNFNSASAGTVIMAHPSALGAVSNTVNFVTGTTDATLEIDTDGGDNLYNETCNSGTTWTIASGRATSGAAINHTMGTFNMGNATMNVTVGANVSSGTPRLTTGNWTLAAGSAGTCTVNPTTANLTIAGTVSGGTSSRILQLDGTSTDNEITGVISGTGPLIKANTSTWKLSGASTYTAGTTISGGTLQLGNGGATGSLSGSTITNDATLIFNRSNTIVQGIDLSSAPISGSGSIIQAGSGSTILSAANTYSGATTVSGGKLLFSTTGSGVSPITVASGAADGVVLAAAGASWTNSADVTQSAGSEVNIDFASFVPSTTVAPMVVNGNFNVSATTTVRVSGDIDNFTVGQTYPLITWTGTGPVSTNGFARILPARVAGNLTVSGNTLSLVVTAKTGPISWNTGNGTWNTTTANWVDSTLAVVTYIDGGDNVLFGSASGATGNPVVTLTNALSPASVTMNSATHNYTLSGAGRIIGSGSLSVENGTLTVATTNGYTGGTTVSGGTLQLSGGGTIGATNNALTVSGGTLDLGGSATPAAGAVTIFGGAIQNGTLTGSSYTASNSGPANVSASLAGAVGLTKVGTGTLTLSGANTYSGATVITNGTLVLSGTNLNTSGIEVRNGAGVTLTVNNASATGSGTINSSSVGGTADIRTINLHINGGGTITLPNSLQGNSGVTSTIDVNNNGSGVNGVIRLTGNNSLCANQTYNVTGGNGYSLVIDHILNQAGVVGSLVINPTGANVTISNMTSTTSTRTNELSGSSPTVNQVIGVISGSQPTVKSGSSTWILSGANTYTGGTIVSGGTLLVDNISGSGTGTGAITVNGGTLLVNGNITSASGVSINGGTLGGTGTINNNVSLGAGGSLAPGASIGTLTINGNLTLAGSLAVEVNKSVSPSNDLCMVSGTLANTGSGWVTVANLGPALANGDKFTLFDQPLANGGALTITPAPGVGLSWSNRLAIDGSILAVTTPAFSYTERIYAVAEGTPNKLLSFQNNAPGTILTEVPLGVEIFGIDFVGETLYGVGSGSLYIIDRVTGATTLVGSFSPVLNGAGFGVEAEPAGVRVVSDLDQQLLLNYGTGAATVGTTLIGGAATTASGMAYHPGTGVRYVIDSGNDTLGTLDPVTGLVTTLGNTGGNDFSRRNAFDISGKAAHTAYVASAAGSSGLGANLYTINSLATGGATLVGKIDTEDVIIRGLAVGPEFSTSAAVNSTPTNITSLVIGGTNLLLAWPSSHLGWTLQKQTNSRAIGLKTNWVDITESAGMTSTNFPVNKNDPTVFYRLRLAVP